MKIDVPLVRKLIASQFPQWASFDVTPVEQSGWDNRTFHLGSEMTVRLPSAERYMAQVAKEQHWLPRLAPLLPYPIPRPLAMGEPTSEYPYPWSIYEWLEGEAATLNNVGDLCKFARSVSRAIQLLEHLPIYGGPEPGPHNFFRGAHPTVYEKEVYSALKTLGPKVDGPRLEALWKESVSSTWQGAPSWIHGDLSSSNLLVRDGVFFALIDFGGLACGDPACDLAITWTFFKGESRRTFREAMGFDEATWLRGAAWTLWKALIVYAGAVGDGEGKVDVARSVIDEILSDFDIC